MANQGILGGAKTEKVEADPKQPDQENKTQEAPVTQVSDSDVQPKLDPPSGDGGNGITAEAEAETRAQADAVRAEIAKNRTRKTPRTEEEAVSAESMPLEPTIVAAYKHRHVRHFKVGDFEFHNHILYLASDESHEKFLDVYDGLPERDQNAIVQYDWNAAARVEQPVRSARGSMSTRDIKDSKVISG